MFTLGDYILRLLGKKEWTAQRLAKEADISHVYVGNLINNCDPKTGKPTKPSIDKLIDLSKALNIPISNLILAYQGIDPDEAKIENPEMDLEELLKRALHQVQKERQK